LASWFIDISLKIFYIDELNIHNNITFINSQWYRALQTKYHPLKEVAFLSKASY